MRGALRIALAYFSGGTLQSWIVLVGGLLVGAGLVLALLAHSASFAAGASNAAQIGIVVLIMGPFYSGGAWQRSASTPDIMHLRPHGRRQMLLGATIAITLIAALFTLGALIEVTWPEGFEGMIPFGLAPAAEFLVAWGGTALVWVATFALSSRPILLAFSWAPLFAGIMLWNRLDAELALTVEQLAGLLFATGIAAWVTFSLWYAKAPNVLRRSLPGTRSDEQMRADLGRLNPGQWFRNSATGDARATRNTAVRRYLTDMESPWSYLAIGAFITLVLAVQYLVFRNVGQAPLTIILLFTALTGASMTAAYIRRARLLWLRAGMDRSALFVTTERLALQAIALAVAIPVAAAATLAVIQHPGATAAILLYTVTQMAFAACAAYTGMTYTRGAPQIFGLFVVLGIPSFVALIKLDPHTVTSPWPQVGALIVFSALALPLRGIAMRSWLRLDWRLTGPPAQRSFT